MRARGYTVFLEGQNDFKLHGKNGATLSGKADIVAILDDDAVVIDCKTGSDKNSNKVQVQLYMLALPLNAKHCRGRRLRGEVQYRQGVVPITAEAVNEELKGRLKQYMDIASLGQEPRRSPSYAECSFCDLTQADCADRVLEAVEGTETDLF